MGRYREYMTGSRLRDPSTSSHDRQASPSQVSTSSSSDPNFMSFRRRARMNARNQEQMMDSRNEHHQSRSTQHESYRSRSPIESRRRKGRESSDESPAPKRRRRDSVDDEERHERHYRRSSPSPMRRGNKKTEYERGRQRNPDPRSASPPTHRRESSRNRKRSPSSRQSSRSPAPRNRHRESRSHHQQSQRKRSRSHSPRHRRQHRSPPRGTAPAGRSHAPLPSQDDAFASKSGSYRPPRSNDPSRSQLTKPSSPPPPKQAPNYAPTGLLAAETNTVANTSIVLKYHEPPTARLPPSSDQWRLFIFKGDSLLSTMNLYERTCWLFGRERLVADCATDHPSCSKQHAVIQFRYTQVNNEAGEPVSAVRPYLIDLESANGTMLNQERVPEKRYVELKTADVVTFGQSEREYVVILPPRK